MNSQPGLVSGRNVRSIFPPICQRQHPQPRKHAAGGRETSATARIREMRRSASQEHDRLHRSDHQHMAADGRVQRNGCANPCLQPNAEDLSRPRVPQP
ncbi:hypothetical protein PtA15_4A150 [Puccinia triticina]|uniref:Uncharacterized protein n=1 Tax=Puccinia triticina TaxID=208348 RepID=A0ABY7CID0_9BASI|nr:uncharacterized protein PtA15_4A150 [Puccinia triticina]WAQ83702.1 hypothetical protein PtA15_4A150 [Puccinia triticina]WAR54550.1 hypothetical protein PtB15_4B167 [Puccinia triticina]